MVADLLANTRRFSDDGAFAAQREGREAAGEDRPCRLLPVKYHGDSRADLAAHWLAAFDREYNRRFGKGGGA